MANKTSRLGRVSALAVVFLLTAYTVVTIMGFRSLASPDDPIGDPWFTLMELLIVLILPFMVMSFAALHAQAPPEKRGAATAALVFMVMNAGLSSGVHFVIMTVSRRIAAAEFPWFDLFFAFKWPSAAYALDILAWDLFYALAMLFGSALFGGSRFGRALRVMMLISGLLSLAGLAGVLLGSMQVRNIGIIGYTLAALPVFALLGMNPGES